MGAQLDNILRNLDRLRREVYLGARDGLISEGEAILSASKETFVPIDQGDLRDSGQISVTDDGNLDNLSVTLSYGDDKTAAYALAVHETPSEHDPPSWTDGVQFKHGGPKYLERPLFEAENGMIERIAAKVANRIK